MPSDSSRNTVSELGPGTPEEEFASFVDALASEVDGRERLTALLHEDHPVYDQRGTSTVVRMRGWILVAYARAGVTDDVLPFVLEELDAGREGYLVAAAARALRSYPSPHAAFAPFVLRALDNMDSSASATTRDS